MKKVLIILMVVCFLIGMGKGRKKEYSHPINDKENQPNIEHTTDPEILKNTSVTITAVGDCTLATDINALGAGSFISMLKSKNNDYSYFFENVKSYFENDDLTIVNFEGTLSNNGSRADKQFAFRGNPEYVKILTSSSIEAANLSNNHSRDYGEISKQDTIRILNENNIACFTKDLICEKEIKNIKVVMYGINALNDEERNSFDSVSKAASEKNGDLTIACFHWGVEKEQAPNDIQKQLAHKAIDNGADLVIGTHPHVLQGIEKYSGKYILYSLGNFCFGGNKNPSDKDTMIFKQTFTFSDNTLLDDDNITIIPCKISSRNDANDYKPTVASGNEKNRISQKITEYTSDLSTDLSLNFE